MTAIELVYDAPHFDQFNDDLIVLLRTLTERGIRLSLHCPFLEVNLSGYFEEVRSFSRLLIGKAIKFAVRAGCDPIVIHPGHTFLMNKVNGAEDEARKHMIEALIPMAAFAKSHGIRLGIENLQMPFFLLHNLRDFPLFKHHVPDLGLVFDLGHAYLMKRREQTADPEGSILEDLRAIGIDSVIHVHLSNNGGAGDEHGFINGCIDLKRVLQWFHDQVYKGLVIIESTEMERLGIGPVLERIREIAPGRDTKDMGLTTKGR